MPLIVSKGEVLMEVQIELPPPPAQTRDSQTLSPNSTTSNDSQIQLGTHTHTNWQQDQNARATQKLDLKRLDPDLSLSGETTTTESGLWMTEECVKFVFDDTWSYNMLECRLCECVSLFISLFLPVSPFLLPPSSLHLCTSQSSFQLKN